MTTDSNDYAPPHAAPTYQMVFSSHQRPLVEPDVRFSRIRLTDDLLPQGIHKELTALFMQVDQPLRQKRSVEVPTVPIALRPHNAAKPDRNSGSCLALWPSFFRKRETSGLRPYFSPAPFYRSRRFLLQAGLPPLSETRSKSCPFAPRELPRFNTTMGKSDSRPEPIGRLCIPLHRLDSGYLLPCPFRRVSQVPWRSFEYMPSPNTPGSPTQRSCSPIVSISGFPIQMEGRRCHTCNEAESSSQMLRPVLYLTLRPFPTLLDDSGCPYTPGRRFRGEQAITAGGITATRFARASPGTHLITGYATTLKYPKTCKWLQGATAVRDRISQLYPRIS